jgi:hypothetical protein
MHPERVEAAVERFVEQHLGDMATLEAMEQILRATNVKLAGDDRAAAAAQNAKVLQSLFLSHTHLARVAGNLAEAAQRLQERIVTLESAIAPLQEAVINLQLRLQAEEEARDRAAG